MSRVIRISDEMYELIENTAFQNRVGIQHLAEEILKVGIEECRNKRNLEVEERGRNIKIEW